MHSKKLRAYIDLGRPVNVGITFVSIPAASILAGATGGQWLEILIAALAGASVAAGANSINDYFDLEIDTTNKPTRPIPRGDATRNEARAEWLVLSVVAILLGCFLNVYALGIVVFAVAMLYWYSAFFKRTAVIGNLVVGTMTGMAFIYGAVVVGNFNKAMMPALFAFLINVAREVIKDIEDVEGDRKEKAMTLPVRYGITPSLVFASIVNVLLIAATIAAYQLKLYNVTYLYLVLFVDLLLLGVTIMMWSDQSPSTMNRLSNGLKVCMVVGLLAIFLGSA